VKATFGSSSLWGGKEGVAGVTGVQELQNL
jgi:hypothetical protein